MRLGALTCGFFLLFGLAVSGPLAAAEQSSFWLIGDSKKQRSEIEQLEAQLHELPFSPPTKKPWSLGFRSSGHRGPDVPIVIDVTMKEAHAVDLIALIPSIVLESDGVHRPIGFPDRFLLECVLENGDYEIIADFRERDYGIEGIEPQLFPRKEASLIKGIRLTTARLSSNDVWNPDRYRLSLSEIMAFSGAENVALREHIEVEGAPVGDRGWYISRLLDGFMTFSPVDREIVKEDQFLVVHADQAEVIFDLGKPYNVDGFRMWPVAHEIHRSYVHHDGHGLPTSISVWALINYGTEYEYPLQLCTPWPVPLATPGSSPYNMKHPGKTTRHVMMRLAEPVLSGVEPEKRLYISEIEILSKGVCVSSGTTPSVSVTAAEENVLRHPTIGSDVKTLTDGVVEDGRILPLREWVEKINRRFVVERRLNLLRQEVEIAENQEKNTYRILTLLLLGAAIVLGLLIWIIRLYATQKLSSVRDQIACDIHDEIGANLNGIALAQELLQQNIAQPTPLQSKLIGDSLNSARKTAQEATRIVKFLEGRAFRRPLEEQIKETGSQILRALETRYHFGPKDPFRQLSPTKKWDLLFFTKEVFNNILKHSEASEVSVVCKKSNGYIELKIEDNGRGISPGNVTPVHLEKRSKRLGAKLSIDSKAGSGTTIVLRFK